MGECGGFDGEYSAAIEMIDVDGNEDGVLFWCEMFIEGDKLLNGHQAFIFGDNWQDQWKEALLDYEGVGEFFIDLCGFWAYKQVLLNDFGQHFEQRVF